MLANQNICLVFHGLRFANETAPYHRELFISVDEAESLLSQLKTAGYSFALPGDVGSEAGPTCSITFDDGYFNNTRFLPLAERHNVPFMLFVASYNIRNQIPFVWDAWAAAKNEPWPLSKIDYRGLYKDFQSAGLAAKSQELASSDLYRPFSVSELKQFAQHPKVHLALHSETHQPAVGCYTSRLTAEIAENKKFLGDLMTSAGTKTPNAKISIDDFAFPCGLYDSRSMREARKNCSRVYTIDGGPMKNGPVISRISLVSPEVGGPLEQQIERWLGWKMRVRRQLTNLRYGSPLFAWTT